MTINDVHELRYVEISFKSNMVQVRVFNKRKPTQLTHACLNRTVNMLLYMLFSNMNTISASKTETNSKRTTLEKKTGKKTTYKN